MDRALRDLVRQRAGDCCEYCRLPQAAVPFISFHAEHVLAQQHGGNDDPDNLAWSCHRCNAYKGTNLSSVDFETGAIVPLFNPRTDNWDEHFLMQGAEIEGLSPIGRATVRLLGFNDSYRLELRQDWLRDQPPG